MCVFSVLCVCLMILFVRCRCLFVMLFLSFQCLSFAELCFVVSRSIMFVHACVTCGRVRASYSFLLSHPSREATTEVVN